MGGAHQGTTWRIFLSVCQAVHFRLPPSAPFCLDRHDPQAVSVPDTTPRSDEEVRVEVGRPNAGWGAKRWSHRERVGDV